MCMRNTGPFITLVFVKKKNDVFAVKLGLILSILTNLRPAVPELVAVVTEADARMQKQDVIRRYGRRVIPNGTAVSLNMGRRVA